jgi:hypothetical protein
VKAAVDIRRNGMAIGGELHADQEALLRRQESARQDHRGINIHPDLHPESGVEFDSVIII